MTTFYVANDGNDSAIGTKESAPWASIDRVNAKLLDGTLAQGDNVLFKRGHEFFGKLFPQSPGYGTTGGYLTFGSYGPPKGRPTLSSYKHLNVGSGWVEHAAGIWKIDLTNPAAWTGFQGVTPDPRPPYPNGLDIGFLRVDGKIFGFRRFSTGDLQNQWDFYCDGTQYLYVKAPARPTTLASDIAASTDGSGIVVRDGLKIVGLKVTGTGGHAIALLGNHIRVFGCELAELGGSVLDGFGDGTTRYGNGFELGAGSSDVIVEATDFRDIFDVAFTLQGTPDGSLKAWTDIVARRNRMLRCNQTFEFWSKGTPYAGSGFYRVVCEDNVAMFAGGWGKDVRSDDRAVHLLTYDWTHPADVTLRNNDYYGADSAYQWVKAPVPGLKQEGNRIFLMPGQKLRAGTAGDPETAADWADWVDVGKDASSRFFLMSEDGPTDLPSALDQVAMDTGHAAARLEILERSVSALRGTVEQESEVIRDLPAKARTFQTSLSSLQTEYAKLASVTINGSNDKVGFTAFYSEGGDSSIRYGKGLIDIKAFCSASNTIVTSMDITELVPFARPGDGSAFMAADFLLVVTETDGAYRHKLSLYFRLRDNFQRLILTPLSEIKTAGRVEFFAEAALLSAAPTDVAGPAVTKNSQRTVSQPLTGSKTWDPASIADGAVTFTSVTVTGAVLGDAAVASLTTALPNGCTILAAITAADTAIVTVHNKSGAPQDIPSSTLRVRVFPATT